MLETESCWELFKNLNILPLHSQYILSLLLFVVKNLNMFKFISVVHTINTRNSFDLYLSSVHLPAGPHNVDSKMAALATVIRDSVISVIESVT